MEGATILRRRQPHRPLSSELAGQRLNDLFFEQIFAIFLIQIDRVFEAFFIEKSKQEFIALDIYFRFDRVAIKDFIIPPKIEIEIELPELQPGSSIMPGKINPVIPEAVAIVSTQKVIVVSS